MIPGTEISWAVIVLDMLAVLCMVVAEGNIPNLLFIGLATGITCSFVAAIMTILISLQRQAFFSTTTVSVVMEGGEEARLR